MIKIFVGCAANNEDLESQTVLHWSLKKNASQPFVICFMSLSKDLQSDFYSDGKSGWQIEHWTTPFSGFRWAVPHLCNYSGEAIYMDSDVIVLGDIAELWNYPIAKDKMVVAKGGKHPQRLCISKWNCQVAKYWLPPINEIRSDSNVHRFLMKRIANEQSLVQTFDPIGNWNALDIEPGIYEPNVKAIHYTGIPTHLGLKHSVPRLAKTGQRHWFTGIPRSHPDQNLQKMFDELLAEAEANDYKISDYEITPFGKYGMNRYPT